MAEKRWIPRLPTVKRIAGRLLRAHRSDAISLGHLEVDACVEALTRQFVPTELRKQLGRMWHASGPALLASGFEDPTRPRNAAMDDALDALLPAEVE